MNARLHPSTLDTWFPTRGARFIDEHYRARRPHVEHGDLARFGLDRGAYHDVHALIRGAQRTYPVTAYAGGPDGVTRPVNTDPEEAVAHYDRGATISVESGVVEGDCELGRALWDSLGCLRALASKNPATLFSQPGAVVPPHFDRIDAFVLVVSGRKEWTIAPNTVPFPSTSRFESGPDPRGGGAVAERQPPHLDQSPLVMPTEGRRHFVMTSGSVAFVPSGWWHTTHATEPTISYTFRGWIEPIATVVLSALGHHLQRLPHWRAPLLMPGGVGEIRKSVLQSIDAVLQTLSEEVRSLEASAVLAQACGAEYRRVPERPYGVVRPDGEPRLRCRNPDGLDAEHPISAEVAAVLEWARMRDSFFTSDLRECVVDPSIRDEALGLLVQHDLFHERHGYGSALRVVEGSIPPEGH